MSRITVTLEGVTWAEIKAQAREIVEASAPRGQLQSVAVAAPVPLPLDKPSSLPFPPPGSGPVCQEHGQPLRPKPAGTNRQGTPYAAGWRCPVSGCRTFVPIEAVG